MDSQHNLVLDVNIWSCSNLWAHWDKVVGTSAQECLTNLWSECLKVNALFEVHNPTGTWSCRAIDLESLLRTRTDRNTHRGDHWIPLSYENSHVFGSRVTSVSVLILSRLLLTRLYWFGCVILQTAQSTSCRSLVKDGQHKSTHSKQLWKCFFFA